jgi:diaminopimelate decarboxylase
MLDPSPILEAVDKALELAAALRAQGHPIRHLDLGGGLGIAYREEEKTPAIRAYVESLRGKLRESGLAATVEPGRSIVGAAGALMARVLYRKRNGPKEFVVVDAAMNDLIRPALYGAHHEIIPVRRNPLPHIVADVVGPICESGDFLARDRRMACVMPGDFLAVRDAGATVSCSPPTTTRAPARRRFWWRAPRGVLSAPARRTKTWYEERLCSRWRRLSVSRVRECLVSGHDLSRADSR